MFLSCRRRCFAKSKIKFFFQLKTTDSDTSCTLYTPQQSYYSLTTILFPNPLQAEKLERDLAALREVVEKLKEKIQELRGIIKEKDLEYDEIKKETMDLLFIKEA